jgi:hypothetical protein
MMKSRTATQSALPIYGEVNSASWWPVSRLQHRRFLTMTMTPRCTIGSHFPVRPSAHIYQPASRAWRSGSTTRAVPRGGEHLVQTWRTVGRKLGVAAAFRLSPVQRNFRATVLSKLTDSQYHLEELRDCPHCGSRERKDNPGQPRGSCFVFESAPTRATAATPGGSVGRQRADGQALSRPAPTIRLLTTTPWCLPVKPLIDRPG